MKIVVLSIISMYYSEGDATKYEFEDNNKFIVWLRKKPVRFGNNNNNRILDIKEEADGVPTICAKS